MKTLALLLPVLALLPLATRVAPQAPLATPAEAAAAREEISAVYDEWELARTSVDKAAFERMLAPDFWVEVGEEKLTRAQFIEEISRTRPGAKLARFDADVLTLAKDASGAWYAVITEKLEVELTGPDGATRRACSLWVTRDGFRKEGERWTILSSEAIGAEGWGPGVAPPVADWES